MELTVNRKDLDNCINAVQRAVNNANPILSNILINTGDGKIILTGNDMEITIESSCDAVVNETGSLLVNAKFLSSIVRKLRKLPEHEVRLKASDSKIEIESGNAKYELPCGMSSQFPSIDNIKAKSKISLAPGIFHKMIRSTIHAAGEDVKRPVFSGALIETSDNIVQMTCCNGFRLSRLKQNNDCETESGSIIIPAKSMKEALAIFDINSGIVIEIDNNVAAISSGSTRMITRLINGQYLDVNKLIPAEFKTKFSVNRKLLLEAIDRTIVIVSSDNKQYPCQFDINGDDLHINMTTNNSRSHEKLEGELTGNDLRIAFNPSYMIESLKTITDEIIEIEFTDSIGPFVIRNEEYLHFILPVRVSDEM